MTTKRVTPEEVKAAYASSGLIVRQGTVFGSESQRKDAGGCCGCAMAALYFDAHPEELIRCEMGEPYDVGAPYQWFAVEYGDEYLSGFLGGFDNAEIYQEYAQDTRWLEGHADGLAAWEAVKPS